VRCVAEETRVIKDIGIFIDTSLIISDLKEEIAMLNIKLDERGDIIMMLEKEMIELREFKRNHSP